MKKLISLFVLCFDIQSFAFNESQCQQAFTGTTETLSSFTDTVRQCLNVYQPGLAGTFSNLVDRYYAICLQVCDSQRIGYCQQMVDAKNRLKAAAPYRCTN